MMDAGGATATFLGDLDDLRVFRRCLPDKEIEALYKGNGDESYLHGEGRVKIGPLRAVGASSNDKLDRSKTPARQSSAPK